MDDQNSSRGKSDHWDLLASTLGAVPPPESAERPAEAEPSPQAQPAEEPETGVAPSPALTEPPSFDQADLLVLPEPAETPPGEPLSGVSEEIVSESRPAGASVTQEQEDLFASLPQSTFVPPRPERRKTPQDWARLASQLGVELPPEAFEPIHTTAETTLEPAPRPSIVVTTLETEPLSPAGKPGTKSREEAAFSRRKPTAQTSSSFGKPLQQADTGSTTPSAGAQAKGDDVDDLLLLPEEAEETPGQAEPSHAAQSSTGAAPADLQPTGTRAKRRRRRKKKSAAAAVETAEAALAQARERVESIEERAFDADARLAESAEPDGSDQDESGQNDDSESEERDEDKSGIHRSIPTWEEAVGIIIAANMEARAKTPERRSAYSPRNRNR